jgi:hypothetical protein
MKRFSPTRQLTYDKVLLAVYILSRDGIATSATCAEVARQAGVSVSTASKRLNDLHVDEIINIRGRGRICRRIFLLLDHPEAVAMRDSMRQLVASGKLDEIDDDDQADDLYKAKIPG